jgi:hypothetical protein
MVKEILAFIALVQNNQVAFNAVTGKLLHHLVDLAGGPDKLGDDENEVACAIRKSMEFLGKKGAKAFMSQDQCELLLKLIPKSKLEAAAKAEAEKNVPAPGGSV